jgi:hypothetical protein
MADPQKKTLDVSIEPDGEELQDGDDTIEKSDEDTEETENPPERETKKGAPKSLFQGKWVILIFLLSLIGGIIGIGILFGPEYVPGWPQKPPTVLPEEDAVDMREEPLAPFFIPLSPGSLKEVIRVDVTMISDGLASLRYSQKDVRIRDRLYRYLVDTVKKDPDLNAQISLLETEMAGILRELLGMNSVLVRVKEVKIF